MAESCDFEIKHISGNLYVLEIDWQVDGSGDFTEQVLNKRIDGQIICVDTNPGSTAPANNYDVSLKNEHGIDVFHGYLDNRHGTNSERAWILFGVTEKVPIFPPVEGCLTLDLLQVTNANANGRIDVYFRRD